MSNAEEVEKSDPFFDLVRQAASDPVMGEEGFQVRSSLRTSIAPCVIPDLMEQALTLMLITEANGHRMRFDAVL